MSYLTRVFNLGPDGHQEFKIGQGARLAALSGEGGTVTLINRGVAYAEGDRDLGDEEFVHGDAEIVGSPHSVVKVYLHI